MAKKRALVACGTLTCALLALSPSMLWGLGTPPRERAVPAAPKVPTLLVVPARYTVVQMAFDIQKLRPVSLVAYDDQAPVSNPVIHFWDRNVRDWIRIDLDQFRSGTLFQPFPAEAVLVGTDQALPSGLIEATGRIPVRKRVEELNLADIANTLHESQAFTPQEWRWLAERYQLKLKDLNYERRRYGRFGKPGQAPQKDASGPRAGREEPLPPPLKVAPRSQPENTAGDEADTGLAPLLDIKAPAVRSSSSEVSVPLVEPAEPAPSARSPDVVPPPEPDLPPEDK